MKPTLSHLLALTAALLISATAQAHLITPAGNSQAGNDGVATLEGLTGVSPLTLLYKLDFGDPEKDPPKLFEETGAYGSNFTISGIDFNAPDSTATISWDLTGSGFSLVAVVWKAGNSFLWSKVSNDQAIIGGPHGITFPDNKDGSHISFYGTSAPVPDTGATLALLGVGLLGLIGVRRYSRK